MAVGAHQREPPPVQTPGNHRRPGPLHRGQLSPAVPVRRHRRSKAAVMSWIEWLNSNHGLIAAVATVVIAFFASITAWLTKVLADENRIMRKAGTEPEVVVYLTTDPRFPHDIFFILANVGRGPAKNVEFTLQGDMNDFKAHQVTSSFTNNSGGKGAGVLPQGERIQSFFGMDLSLLATPQLRPFNVSLTYEDFNGKAHKTNQELDVAELGWIVWLTGPGSERW